MHGLCLGCHREEENAVAVPDRYLSRCTTCHRNEFGADSEMLRHPPFAVVAEGRAPDTGGTTGGSP
jgi:hypothetical protein